MTHSGSNRNLEHSASYPRGTRVWVRAVPGQVRACDAHGRLLVLLCGDVRPVWLMPCHVTEGETE